MTEIRWLIRIYNDKKTEDMVEVCRDLLHLGKFDF